MSERIGYPFKSVSQVFERDCSHPRISLGQHHQILDGLQLHAGVPLEVRELYETARNIALYSHFAYRLQQPAEMTGFAAFEMALRTHARAVRPDLFEKKTPPTLGRLAQVAVEEEWLADERYPSRRARAEQFAQHKRFISDTDYMRQHGLAEMPASEPTESEIDAAMQELTIAEDFLQSVPKRRNTLAHGSSMMMPSAFGTLGLICESINQLFNCPAEAAS